ncbi:MAG TPA: DUF998 domain-containing protein [Thermoplasmataceae archaeon]|nr:DUF998 domain-containing protein [Thermoplasmataceae archaeon]
MSSSYEIATSGKRRNPGTGFALGGIIALMSITAATAVYPSYSERSQAISYLGGAGVTTEIFWNISVIIVGVLWLWSTYLLFRNGGFKIRPVIYALAGLGFLLVGLSPWDVFPTTHYLGANLIFVFGALSSILAYRMTSGAMAKISVLAGIFSFVSYFGGYVGFDYILGPGGAERMIFYPILLWQIAFGGYLLGHSQNQAYTG